MAATKDLMLVVVGGAIALLGGLVTSITSYQLGTKENQRMELNRAYADWGSEFQHVLEAEKDRYLFDAYELAKTQKDALGPPWEIEGRNSNEITLENSKAKILFRAAKTRLLFLEMRSKHIEKIRRLSRIEYENWPDKKLAASKKQKEIDKLSMSKYKKKLVDFNASRTDCLILFQRSLQGGKKKMNSKEPNKNC
ncbi:hypothetical protein ACFL4I_00265 [Pseudomonadota bacterium]